MVESTRKVFPTREQFWLGKPEPTTVLFDYVDNNLWCCYCLSYRHFAKLCRRPKPAFFSTADIVFDTVPKAPKQRPAHSGATAAQAQRGTQRGVRRPAARRAEGEDRVTPAPVVMNRRYRPCTNPPVQTGGPTMGVDSQNSKGKRAAEGVDKGMREKVSAASTSHTPNQPANIEKLESSNLVGDIFSSQTTEAHVQMNMDTTGS